MEKIFVECLAFGLLAVMILVIIGRIAVDAYKAFLNFYFWKNEK